MRLFVYGTLRRTGSAAQLMKTATFLGEAKIRARREANGLYPGIVAGGDEIEGELYEIPESLIATLDEYEGPNYERREIEIEGRGKAWVYFNR